MCSNYQPVTRADRLLSFFDVLPQDSPTMVAFPTGLAPFIRLSDLGKREALDGRFGLLPVWAKELNYGRKTYNARTETVVTLPRYRSAWRKGQRCIIPAETIFEPCYETGKAVRWGIQQPCSRNQIPDMQEGPRKRAFLRGPRSRCVLCASTGGTVLCSDGGSFQAQAWPETRCWWLHGHTGPRKKGLRLHVTP